MYVCHECEYTTPRKDSYLRHQTSKKHLRKISNNSDHNSQNTFLMPENVVRNPENVVQNPENVVQNLENVVQNLENVVRNSECVSKHDKQMYHCRKCNKTYKTQEYLTKHEHDCKGIDSLTCPRCMRTFADRKSKCKHRKMNNCKPVSIFEADNVKSIINNNNNTNQSYNTNSLNTTNISNTNIYINNYGHERKDYLLNYDNFYDIIRVPNNNILVKYLRCKNFNPKFPENHCIKYENRCFKLKENNNWRLINPSALKDKLFNDCGSEVLYVFQTNEEKIKNQMKNPEFFHEVKKKSSYIELTMDGYDKEIKNSMLDVVKDTV